MGASPIRTDSKRASQEPYVYVNVKYLGDGVTHDLDVEPVRVEHVGGIVGRAVALSKARPAVVLAARRKRRRMEGFYLPALEAMALGSPVVVPDCVGNRVYLEPDANALVPGWHPDEFVAAVLRLEGDPSLAVRLVQAGRATVRRFGMEREREAFHAILDDLEGQWRA